MGSNITDDPAFKALQKSVQSLEAYADKIDNLSSMVASFSATQHKQAATLVNLEKMAKQLLNSHDKTPAFEDESEIVHHPDGDSTKQGDVPPPSEECIDSTPEISLNALTGVTKGNIMKGSTASRRHQHRGTFGHGSSDNFINEDTARDLGLQISQLQDLRVRVVHQDRLAAIGVCGNVNFSTEAADFSTSYFVIMLAGFQMVLGEKWLDFG